MSVPTLATLRRFWALLWFLAVGMILLLLFVTLRDRLFDPEAAGHFAIESLRRGRQFSQEVRLVRTLQAILSLGILVGLCFHPIGARFLCWLERLGRGRRWAELVAIAGGIALIAAVFALPFDFYMGHLHEQAYGLTNQGAGEWLTDHLAATLIDFGLTLLLWLPLFWLIRRWPRGWWAPAAGLHTIFTGLIILVGPILLLPLQGELVPVRDPEVRAMIHQLAEKAGVEIGTVQEMLVSKKSSRVNAMVTGLGPTKRVILYDTLMQQFEPQEVAVVMAHEMAHAIHQDVLVFWIISGAGAALSLFLAAWMLRAMVGIGPLHLPTPHSPRALAPVLLLLALLGHLTGPVENFVSRQMEVRADRFALDLTEDPAAFISGFRRLAKGNPSDVDPPWLVELLSHSHPSVMNRIRMAEREMR